MSIIGIPKCEPNLGDFQAAFELMLCKHSSNPIGIAGISELQNNHEGAFFVTKRGRSLRLWVNRSKIIVPNPFPFSEKSDFVHLPGLISFRDSNPSFRLLIAYRFYEAIPSIIRQIASLPSTDSKAT